MSESRHWPALDGLRGLAILLVIPHNLDVFDGASRGQWIPAAISHMGWIGVQIFFVLSGFLITTQLLRSARSPGYFRVFYARRILRIFPLYYGTLITLLLIVPLFATLPSDLAGTRRDQIWLWLFLNNWVQPFEHGVQLFSHFWSLAVEEQFYLVWPLVVLAFPGGRRFLWACIGVIIAALVSRFFVIQSGLPEGVPYQFTICRMDALAIGAAAASMLADQPRLLSQERQATRVWWIAAAGLVIGAITTHLFDLHRQVTSVLGYPLLAAITAATILICVEKRGQGLPDVTYRALSLPVLRSVGRFSFAMYVFQTPLRLLAGPQIRSALESHGLKGPYWYTAAFIFLTYLLGAASYYLFERHFLALKRYFRPPPAASHAGA